jgi:hypothetical protein
VGPEIPRVVFLRGLTLDAWIPRDNTFAFALDSRKGETLLQFVQECAQALSNEAYGTYNFNWGYYLNSLKQLCEKGAGYPSRRPVRPLVHA